MLRVIADKIDRAAAHAITALAGYADDAVSVQVEREDIVVVECPSCLVGSAALLRTNEAMECQRLPNDQGFRWLGVKCPRCARSFTLEAPMYGTVTHV